MDFSHLVTAEFFVGLLSIVMIDVVLAGDNSIVIAMAVQSLPKEKKFKGILLGALAAVVLRVIFTFFASKMLLVPFVKLVGGVLILWIAVKLLRGNETKVTKDGGAKSVWSAVWIILVADLTMSLDNILAVAGASHGNLPLLLFGLGLSIPLVVFASTLISRLMERFPIVIWIGALILGKVGGEMIITDPVVVSHLLTNFGLTDIKNGAPHPDQLVMWGAEIIGVLLIAVFSLIGRKKKTVALGIDA